jgi:hypothetical protein
VLDKLGFERRGLTEYKGVQTTFHVLTRDAWIDFVPGAPP